jgi:taurine dioxygenase
MDALAAVRSVPLKPGFGAEIKGVDLRTADPAAKAEVVTQFHRHGAVLLRDQTLAPEDLLAFIRLFGEPEGHTLQEFTLPGHPFVYVLSNKVVDGRPIGAHNDGVYAVETPPEGADTLIADCVAAFDALTPARRAELETLRLHHSYAHFMRTREWGAMELSDALKRDNPDVVHPLIRTHPVDGRKALWVSTGTVVEVIGRRGAEGHALIEELVAFVTQDRFVYRHKWRVGDVLMWDNRCTLHTGTLYDDRRYDRLMHRLWVKGDRPY